MADIVTHSWITSFPGAPTAIARAGNVIGGGDVSPDRLLPDLINSYAIGKSPVLRYPQAVRPWQHVLDCLNGYLMICDRLLSGQITDESFNIGPDKDSFVPVGEVADLVAELWGYDSGWQQDKNSNPHEAGLLALDATKATELLKWRNKLMFRDAIEWTVDWKKKYLSGASARELSQAQLRRFLDLDGS
jgi:CDP-glucose 4,6-dehydratase